MDGWAQTSSCHWGSRTPGVLCFGVFHFWSKVNMVHISSLFRIHSYSVCIHTPSWLHDGVEIDKFTVSPPSNYSPHTDQTIINIIQTQKQTSTESPHGHCPHFQSVICGCIMTLLMYMVTNLFHFARKQTVINVTCDHTDHRCQARFKWMDLAFTYTLI